jgi:hypothetical protein
LFAVHQLIVDVKPKNPEHRVVSQKLENNCAQSAQQISYADFVSRVTLE